MFLLIHIYFVFIQNAFSSSLNILIPNGLSFNFVRISFKSFYIDHLCCWYPPNSSHEFTMVYSVWWRMVALWVCLTYTAHVLGGCSITMSQDHFTNQHNQVLHSLVSKLSDRLERLADFHPPFPLLIISPIIFTMKHLIWWYCSCANLLYGLHSPWVFTDSPSKFCETRNNPRRKFPNLIGTWNI